MLKLKDLIERDLKPKQQYKYQIQAQKDSDIVRLACVKEQTDFCLLEEKFEDFTCSLLSYTLSEQDIENKMYLIMGYLIKNSINEPVATLNFVFFQQGEFAKEMQGKFKIVLSNNKNNKTILKEIEKYPGDE